MHTQLNKNELINVLFCPEGCHAMYAASKLDGYPLQFCAWHTSFVLLTGM